MGLFHKDTHKFSTNRLEALTDGVFAIVMTLLVLDLNIRELGEAATNGELWHSLQAMEPRLISFVISFLLLGSMWAVHVRQFEHIEEADRRVTFINTWRLLVVAFIPFTTSIASTYPELALAQILFPLNFLLLSIVSMWQWTYAAKNLKNTLSKEEKQRAYVRNVAVIITAAGVLILSPFIGTLAFLLFLISPLIMQLFIKPVEIE